MERREIPPHDPYWEQRDEFIAGTPSRVRGKRLPVCAVCGSGIEHGVCIECGNRIGWGE